MTAKALPSGLAYKKLDLHVHTPASKCFLGDSTPGQIVEAAIKAGLDGIAVTDHNTATGIDAIKEAAKGKSLVVFPGVEISCTGGKRNIHILAFLDPSASGQDVMAILNVLGILPSEYGLQDSMTVRSPIEVIECIHRLGGLASLAHANSGERRNGRYGRRAENTNPSVSPIIGR